MSYFAMNRLDRALGILLLLRGGATLSAAALARHFEVSPRTIYRDVEALSAIGVPVYAEMGRNGGFRLSKGYFLPPIMFSRGEATALLVGIAMLRRLRATPFAADLETAARKVIAALPESFHTAITSAQRAIGFEAIPADPLHPERAAKLESPEASDPLQEAHVLSVFLQAIVDTTMVSLRYQPPDEYAERAITMSPRGLVWDRDRWYLVGTRPDRAENYRLWRADRVRSIKAETTPAQGNASFDIHTVLDRRWLDAAMAQWATEAPVTLALTRRQAEQLQTDWYYRHARFADLADGRVAMTFGEDDQAVVFTLLRWLGPGAQLLEPQAWRAAWRAELHALWQAAEE